MNDLVERLRAVILTAADAYEQRLKQLEAHRDTVHNHHPFAVLLCMEELRWWQYNRNHSK